MSGINGIKQVVDAELQGRMRNFWWRKNPSQVTTAGIWFDLANTSGNPSAKQWFDAAPLTATPVLQSADKGLYHGANVTPDYKYLRTTLSLSNSATPLPMQMILCDYVMYYPTIDDSESGLQSMTNTFGRTATFSISLANLEVPLFTYGTTTHQPQNLLTGTPVTLSSTGTLPMGLSDATTYYLIAVSTTTFKLASSLANARLGVSISASDPYYTTDAGTGTHSVSWLLPRYTNGQGLKMVCITTGARTGGQTFTISYTNQDGISGRTSQVVTQNTSSILGTITSSALAVGQGTAGPFIGLQDGDSSVMSVDSVQMIGSDTGFFTIVLVRPLTETQIRGIDAPVEKDHLIHAEVLPRVYDDAFLGYLCLPNGSLAGTGIMGNIKVIWN